MPISNFSPSLAVVSREIVTRSSEDTIQWGREIGAQLMPPVLVLLSGDLGAGKTTLTKGIVSGLGAAEEEEVTSPTFTLVHKYGRGTFVYHVDLFRIGNSRDLETLGLEDVFSEQAIVIVEWPDKLIPPTGWPVLRIHLDHVNEEARRISVEDAASVLGSRL